MARTTFDIDTKQVPVADIKMATRLRRVDQAHVELLADSMRDKGLIQSIVVEKDGTKLTLVAGAHRLAAAKQLGWDKIEARLTGRLTANDRRLLEIDENLARHDLNPLDRAIFMAQRKRIFELENPEIGHGGDRKSDQALNISTWSSFSEETAKELGFGESTIRRAVAIAQGLAPATRKALAGTPLCKKEGELFKLSKLPKDDQMPVLELALAEDAPLSIDAANRLHRGEEVKPKDPVAEQAAKLNALWDKLPKKVRIEFVRKRWDELALLKGDA